jgi:hypothetical protein
LLLLVLPSARHLRTFARRKANSIQSCWSFSVFVVRVLSGAKLVQKKHLVQKKGFVDFRFSCSVKIRGKD